MRVTTIFPAFFHGIRAGKREFMIFHLPFFIFRFRGESRLALTNKK